MRLLIILLLLGGTLSAQNEDTLLLSVDLADIVVTAQYAPTDVRNAVHNVTVLKLEEWRQQGVVTLAGLLQRQLTMSVTPDPILGSGLSIQGLGGQNVQIMIDGVPVVGRLGGEIDLNQLNLSRFVRVEIIAGSLSAQYGTDAAGGVINLITAKEQAMPWKLETGGQYESVGYDQTYLRVGRQLGDFQVDGGVNRISARYGSVDSIRAGVVPWNPKNQVGGDMNLRYRPTDSLSIHYGYQTFTERLSLLGPVRRPQFRPYLVDQLFDTERNDHSLSANYQFASNWTANFVGGLNHFTRHKRTQRLDIEPDTTSLQLGGQDTTRYTGQLARLSVSSTTNGRFDVQVGLEYRRETGAGGRILDVQTLDREPIIRNAAAWAGLTYRPLPTWTVEATARVGHNNRYSHPVIPALHVLWKPRPELRFRASAASGFRSPSLQELFFNFIDGTHFITGNQRLLAERSRNLRLSGEWSSNNNLPITVSGEFFHNEVSNRITLADVDQGRFSYVNLSNYQTHGLSSTIQAEPLQNLKISLGAAITRLLNPLANSEQDVPQFLSLGELRLEANYLHAKTGISLLLDHRYVGRRDRYQLTAEGSVISGFVGDYHLLNFTGNKSFLDDRINLNVGVKNLLNRERLPITGGGGGGAHSGGGSGGGQLIDLGRRIFVGLRVGI